MTDLQDDASEAEWFDVRDLPQPLAFDHKLIVRTAFHHLMQQPAVKGTHSLLLVTGMNATSKLPRVSLLLNHYS